MSRIFSPCKGCENRVSGCHSGCDAYAEFRETRDKIAECKKKESDAIPEPTATFKKNLKRKLKGG